MRPLLRKLRKSKKEKTCEDLTETGASVDGNSFSKVPKLSTSKSDFSNWRLRFEAVLGALNLHSVVTGKAPRLPRKSAKSLRTVKEREEYKSKFESREHKHAVVWNLLVQACGSDLTSLISPHQHTKDCVAAWRGILQYFGEDASPVAQFNAMAALLNLRMDSDEGVDIELRFQRFVADIERESSTLGTLQGVPVQDAQKVFVLMRGMPPAFHDMNKVLLTNMGKTFVFPKACEAVRHSLQQDRIQRQGRVGAASQKGLRKSKADTAPPVVDDDYSSDEEVSDGSSGPADFEEQLASLASDLASKHFKEIVRKLEEQRQAQEPVVKKKSKRCARCGGRGHKAKVCPSPGEDDSDESSDDEVVVEKKRCKEVHRSGEHKHHHHAGAAMSQEDVDLLNYNNAVLNEFMQDDSQ